VLPSVTVQLSHEYSIAVGGIACHLNANGSNLRFGAHAFEYEPAGSRKSQYQHARHNFFHSCSPSSRAALLRRSREIWPMTDLCFSPGTLVARKRGVLVDLAHLCLRSKKQAFPSPCKRAFLAL
jgi:hypothetical protein